MAIICSTRFPKCSSCLIFLRLLNNGRVLKKTSQFSTSKLLVAKSSAPIKYTTNKASKLQIADTIGFQKIPERERDPNDFRSYILVGGTSIFLIYFCILREENDIDEILKGNPAFKNKAAELYDLKIKLKFCQQNKLPTDALKAKIEELEKDQKITSPFLK